MFCLKCGEAIPDNSEVCPKCGAVLSAEDSPAVVYASQKQDMDSAAPPSAKKAVPKRFVLLGSIIIAVVIVFLIISGVQKSALKTQLQKDWIDTDGTILKILEFSDSEVEYRLETGYSWMNTTVFTNDYKLVSGSKIKINMYGDDYETYTIEFNDDKTIMTISPAVTSTDRSEKWYNIDY